MGVVTQEYIVGQLLSTDPQVKENMFKQVKLATGTLGRYLATGRHAWDAYYNIPPIDVAAARAMYDELKDYVLDRGSLMGKRFRPYLCTNVNDMGLDPEQPWWGFEFETGYSSSQAMRTALEYCWDTYDNVTFDSEGEGNYYSEVTFAPANMSDFVNGTADAQGYINYLSSNSTLTYHSGHSMVGTHINISIPCMRSAVESEFDSAKWSKLSAIRRALNYSVGCLDSFQLMEIFGRAPLYGGFFLNGDDKGNYRYEGKVFRTTYDAGVFQGYVTASRGITAAIVYLEAHPEANYIENMYELMKDPSVEIKASTSGSMKWSSSSLSPEGGPNYACDYDEYDDDDDEDDFCNCSDCVEAQEEF